MNTLKLTMKNYEKFQYTGNENGWGEPKKSLGITAIHESTADELNSHFRNTGVMYEATSKKHGDFEATTDEFDHGNPNLVVKDGKVVKTKHKAKDKQKEVAKKKPEVVTEPKKDAKPSDTTFVRSDAHIEDAIDQVAADKMDSPEGTAGNQ